MKRETILTILLAIAVLLLLKECNNNGKDITFKTKEVRGGFEMVKPKQKEITRSLINDVSDKDKSSTVKENLTVQNDSINTKLLAENEALIKAFATYTDSVKQAKYLEAITLRDYSQDFTDSIQTISVFGKVRGEVIGMGLEYKVFPMKVSATLKQYTVFLGLNTVSNPSFSNTSVLPTISYLNANGMLFTAGKDIICNDCYMAGLQTRIFSINRVKR